MTTTPGELVGLPDGGPTSVELVKAHLKITDTRDDVALGTIVDAVNNLVRSMAVSRVAVEATTWPDRIVYGATMLSGRLFRRKNSPAGVESFGSLGAAYVMRNDPDIAQLLELGSYQNPAVG